MSVASQCPACGESFRGQPPACPQCGIELYWDEKRDPALAIADVLTPEQRDTILAGMVANSPGWEGADVADMLAESCNADAYLGEIEPFYEAHGQQLPRGEDYELTTHAVYALVILGHYQAGPALNLEAVVELVSKAREAGESSDQL